MKKKKLISLLLSLSIIGTMMMPGTTAFAAGGSSASGSTNGMEINKTATANGDGTYTVQLEAYATGDKIISEITKDIPTDIVLVLAASGSMDSPLGKTTFYQYHRDSTNYHYYKLRHNGGAGNLYYPLGNGSYASVSVLRQSQNFYTEITDSWPNYSDYTYDNYYDQQDNLYALVGGSYKKVTVSYK